MEANVHSFMLWPQRALETIVTQCKNVEQRLPSDTAEPQGMQETIVMEWKVMESSVSGCVLMEPRRPLWCNGISRKQVSIVSLLLISETLQMEGLVKSWLSLILQLIRKGLWERDSIELGVEKQVI